MDAAFPGARAGETVGQEESIGETDLRRKMAAAIRVVLAEGMGEAEDPVGYLRSAADEIRELVSLFDGADGAREGAAIRAILAEEVQAATDEMLRRLHH